MYRFKEWFKNKLKVGRYPLPTELQKSDFKYVINVSDEYIPINQEICIENNIKYFWFPMDEVSSNIGVNSIYGALQILYIAEKEDSKVLLHCHAGVNRSATVADAYYFMRTKKHLLDLKTKEDVEFSERVFVGYKDDGSVYKNNMLLNNIEEGRLPSIRKFEDFLISLEQFLNKQDELITEGGLNTIKIGM